MLEELSVFFLKSFFPLIFLGIALIFWNLRISTRHKVILLTISITTGLIVSMLTAVGLFATFFIGNFSAPTMATMFAPLAGGVAALIVFLIGIIFYTIPNLLLSYIKKRPVNKQPINSQPKIMALGIIILCIAFGEGYLLWEIGRLKDRYGGITGNARPLTETEIRQAYNNIIFRNHNLLIRGLLNRPNVPPDIIVSIFRQNKNDNVISSVLFHNNTPCTLLTQYFQKKENREGSPAIYDHFRKRCVEGDTLYRSALENKDGKYNLNKLIEELGRKDLTSNQKIEVLQAIRTIGPQAHKAVPAVITCLDNYTSSLEYMALVTLDKIVSSDDVDYLLNQAESASVTIRARVINLLGMPKLYKTAAEKIEARLLPRLKNDPDRWCRYEIISLLGKIKSTAAIPQIQEVIQTEVAAGHEYLLEPSAEALGEIGVLNESISADLKHLISLNIDNRIRAKAIWALGELKDYSAIPLLIQELSKKTQTNENASTAFKQLLEAETNKEADKALSQVYKEQYANKEADKALGQFRREIEIKEMTVTALEGLHAVESIPYLIELYKKSPGYLNGQLRLKIVQALGNLRAKEAISLLESARHDDYNICSPQIPISSCYPVRGAAMVALKQIKNSN